MLKKLLFATMLVFSNACFAADEPKVAPRIVDGTLVPAAQFPTVGKVGRASNPSICTGTLIAPRFVITAAHCVYSDSMGAIAFKQDEGRFLLGGNLYNTAHIYVHPSYRGLRTVSLEGVVDLAIYELDRDVPGVTPSPMNTLPPAVKEVLTLAGYGALGTGTGGATSNFPPDGMIGTGHTPIDFLTDTYIKWRFDKMKPPFQESDTATGDSGGPQFLTQNGTLVLASVTSGGFVSTSKFGDLAFNTRIDSAMAWIQAIVGGPPTPLNNAPVIQSLSAEPGSAPPQQTVTFSAAAGDLDLDGLNFNWFFGDGTEVQSGGASQTHAYSMPGTYLVQLVVTDGKGGSTTDTLSFSVSQTVPPTQPIAFPKRTFKVDFKRQTGASMTLAMRSPNLIFSSASGFKQAFPDGSVVSVGIDGTALQTFKLTGSHTKIGNDSVSFDYRKGIVTFQTKSNLAAAGILVRLGAVNATTTKLVVVPVALRVDELRFFGDAEFIYKAKANVSGAGTKLLNE